MAHNYDNVQAPTGITISDVKRHTDVRSAGISVEVIRDDANFHALQEQWMSVLSDSSASVYQTHEWLRLWWKNFRTPDCSLFILAVRRGHRLLALVPLYIHAQRLMGFRICRRLKLMGDNVVSKKHRGLYAEDGPSDYLDIIVAEADAVTAIVESIVNHRHLYDEIDFSNVPEQSVLKTTLQPALEARGFETMIHRAQPCPYLTTPDALDEYLKRLQTSTRRKFNHARKKFFHDRGYTIEHITHSTDLASAFRDLTALHQRRWNRAGYIGLFRDRRYERFIADIVHVFQERGWLWFKSVVMGGTRFAVRMGFRFNGRYYDYLSGFDDDAPFAKARPGYALLLSFIEDAVAERCRKIDFLRGAEPYKFDLTSTVTYNWAFRAIAPEYRKTFSYKLSRVMHVVEDVLHRVKREWLILNIYFNEHGVFLFIPEYVRSLTRRILEKVKQRLLPAIKNGMLRFVPGTKQSDMAQPPQQDNGLQELVGKGKDKQYNVRAG